MSDQGDAGQWRPATNQNDRYSAPDDTTGPLPAVAGNESDEQGFPSMSPPAKPSSGVPSWADDDAPTGGFPAVSLPDEPEPEPEAPAPAAPSTRSVFEPVDRTEANERPSYDAPEVKDPGPTGATPRFGTDVPASAPEPSSFDTHHFGTHQYDTAPVESHEPKPYGTDPAFGSEQAPLSDPGWTEPKYGGELGSEQAPPSEPSWTEPKYGGELGSEFGRTESASSASSASSRTDSPGPYGTPPAPKRGVTAEDEAAENDFFASDDHPPMWDKVVAPSGPPPKPGKPSSGNLRLPEWMREEQRAAESGAPAAPGDLSGYEDEEGHSRRPLWIGLGVLVAGLLAAGGVYALKGGGGNQASNASAPSGSSQAPATPSPSKPAGNTPQQTKRLPQFKGVHTKAMGRVSDRRAGLSYAHLAKPWQLAPKKSPMNELGFDASQFAVTEKAGGQPKHWARLMSAQLPGAAKQSYQGPGTERAAAADLIQVYEARMFSFRHHKRRLANQPLTVGGHKGWLVSDYVTYRRGGLKSTGDVVALAVVDTGKQSPGVVYMSVPNTTRKLWPDINFVMRSLQVG